jgi:hypothetical protein
MNPILSRRTRVSDRRRGRERFAVDAHLAGRGAIEPPIRLSRVDLPDPDGPMIDTISPRGMVSEISSSAVT